MEENKPDIIDVELVPQNAEITFKVNSDFYVRFQQLLLTGLAYQNQEHFQKCLDEIKNNNIEDPIAYHMQTVLHIIARFEEAARKENLLIKRKFSFTDNKYLDDEPSK